MLVKFGKSYQTLIRQVSKVAHETAIRHKVQGLHGRAVNTGRESDMRPFRRCRAHFTEPDMCHPFPTSALSPADGRARSLPACPPLTRTCTAPPRTRRRRTGRIRFAWGNGESTRAETAHLGWFSHSGPFRITRGTRVWVTKEDASRICVMENRLRLTAGWVLLSV